MSIAQRIATLNRFTRPLEALAPLLALATRLYVSWVFLKSGWLKVSDWETTQYLFHNEYRVPLLPPDVAAVAGAVGELFFPVLLILGLCGRLSALGLQAVNVLAVVSYAHVLLSDGYEGAIAQHYLWGFMLIMLAVYGPGSWSVDGWLARRRAASAPVGVAVSA
ncbi:MAG TPA: DoxX family protein [Povalibacter sp.]|nr:DoxX family protein [Povalibacter sp.]